MENKTILEALSEEFDSFVEKQHTLDNGFVANYVEPSVVIKRLNEVLEGVWSFEVKEAKFFKTAVCVLGKLTIPVFGVVEQWGSVNVSGDIGIDIKAATSDALKKCATLRGVALYLYDRKEIINKSDTPIIDSSNDEQNEEGKEFETIKNLMKEVDLSPTEREGLEDWMKGVTEKEGVFKKPTTTAIKRMEGLLKKKSLMEGQ